MNTSLLFMGLEALIFTTYVLALIFVVGIVWRVERELDTTYKFFALAVLFLIAAEILGFWPSIRETIWWAWAFSGSKFLAALMLFLGMYFMRDLVRRIDGEK